MTLSRSLYDVFVCLYAVSLVLFFIDAMQPHRSVNRLAVVLLFSAFSLETVFLLDELLSLGYVPIYNPYDVGLLLSWLVLLVVLCINAFFRVGMILFFANVFGFAFVVANAAVREASIGPSHHGDLLTIHIVCALMSYVAFCLAVMYSGMYLIGVSLLRRKQWNSLFLRLPSLSQLDFFAYRSVMVGYPLLTIGIVLGGVLEQVRLGRIVWLDSKPIVTLVVWLMYGIYLLLRTRWGWGGANLAKYALVCFAVVLVNLWIAGRLSSFHHTF